MCACPLHQQQQEGTSSRIRVNQVPNPIAYRILYDRQGHSCRHEYVFHVEGSISRSTLQNH